MGDCTTNSSGPIHGSTTTNVEPVDTSSGPIVPMSTGLGTVETVPSNRGPFRDQVGTGQIDHAPVDLELRIDGGGEDRQSVVAPVGR